MSAGKNARRCRCQQALMRSQAGMQGSVDLGKHARQAKQGCKAVSMLVSTNAKASRNASGSRCQQAEAQSSVDKQKCWSYR
ncbi:unnamed protein product [Gongylonema pulchrum]|uniref:4F5 domain-containing protein n=1 Tax=Gongylonema pulchrum TaxID=637853 RepID=A0A183DNA5_9BILA|nr:unnamed protein product [Gongylonema pulchrum]